MQINSTCDLLREGFYNFASYEAMGADGVPTKMGPLLRKYGECCGYSIRDKDTQIELLNYDPNVISFTLTCQCTPLKPAKEMLSELFTKTIPEHYVDKYNLYAKGKTVYVTVQDRDESDFFTFNVELN